MFQMRFALPRLFFSSLVLSTAILFAFTRYLIIALLFLFLAGCGNHPIDSLENTLGEENIKAFHWQVSSEEAARAQKIFPKLGGVLKVMANQITSFLEQMNPITMITHHILVLRILQNNSTKV